MSATLRERTDLYLLSPTVTSDWFGPIAFSVEMSADQVDARTWSCHLCHRRGRTATDVRVHGSDGMRGLNRRGMLVDVPFAVRYRSTIQGQRVDLCQTCANYHDRCWECGPTDEGVQYNESADVELCAECWRLEDD